MKQKNLLFSLLKIVKIIAVQGNIGVGKTTYIQNYKTLHPEENVIQLQEDLDKWQVLFSEYYNIVSSNKQIYSDDEQAIVGAFQLMTAITRLQQYQLIDYQSDNTYIFERTIQESLDCFLPTLKRIIQSPVIYNTIFDLQHQLCLMEPTFTECVLLEESVPTCYERILKRNRPGEKVDIDYLYELQKQYSIFKQRNNKTEQQFKNQQYLVGGVGSGKTTFLNKLKSAGIHTITEPIDYWNYSPTTNLLQKHLNNIKHNTYQNPWTFILQCRILCSRLTYRYDNTVYERNIMEEPFIFMVSYKHAFTEIQYNLLQQLYQLIIPQFQQGTFYYMDVSPEIQFRNIRRRNRQGEENYTQESINNLNQLYKEFMTQFEGRVYYISY